MKKMVLAMMLMVIACTSVNQSLAAETSRVSAFNTATTASQQSSGAASARVVALGANASTDDKTAMETALLLFYAEVQGGCSTQLSQLETRRDGFSKAKSNLTAWGSLVTLIGGVTVYAPAKAVLMGVGISAGNDSSVLGGLAGSADASKSLTQTDIDNLKKNYIAAVTNFNSKTSAADPTGWERNKALIELKAACVGLASFLDTPSGS